MKKKKKLTSEELLDIECGATNDISGEFLRVYTKKAIGEKEKYFFQRIIPRINGLLIKTANKGYFSENITLSKVTTFNEHSDFGDFDILSYSDKIIQYYEKVSIECKIHKSFDLFDSIRLRFGWEK